MNHLEKTGETICPPVNGNYRDEVSSPSPERQLIVDVGDSVPDAASVRDTLQFARFRLSIPKSAAFRRVRVHSDRQFTPQSVVTLVWGQSFWGWETPIAPSKHSLFPKNGFVPAGIAGLGVHFRKAQPTCWNGR